MVVGLGGIVAVVSTGGVALPVFASAASAAAAGGAVSAGVVTASGAATTAAITTTTVVGTTGGLAGLLLGCILAGPLGWVTLGAKEALTSNCHTFDCWKQVLHDHTEIPSNGKLSRDVCGDGRIKSITVAASEDRSDQTNLILENVWNEQFRIDFVQLSPSVLAAHAVRI